MHNNLIHLGHWGTLKEGMKNDINTKWHFKFGLGQLHLYFLYVESTRANVETSYQSLIFSILLHCLKMLPITFSGNHVSGLQCELEDHGKLLCLVINMYKTGYDIGFPLWGNINYTTQLTPYIFYDLNFVLKKYTFTSYLISLS